MIPSDDKTPTLGPVDLTTSTEIVNPGTESGTAPLFFDTKQTYAPPEKPHVYGSPRGFTGFAPPTQINPERNWKEARYNPLEYKNSLAVPQSKQTRTPTLQGTSLYDPSVAFSGLNQKNPTQEKSATTPSENRPVDFPQDRDQTHTLSHIEKRDFNFTELLSALNAKIAGLTNTLELAKTRLDNLKPGTKQYKALKEQIDLGTVLLENASKTDNKGSSEERLSNQTSLLESLIKEEEEGEEKNTSSNATPPAKEADEEILPPIQEEEEEEEKDSPRPESPMTPVSETVITPFPDYKEPEAIKTARALIEIASGLPSSQELSTAIKEQSFLIKDHKAIHDTAKQKYTKNPGPLSMEPVKKAKRAILAKISENNTLLKSLIDRSNDAKNIATAKQAVSALEEKLLSATTKKDKDSINKALSDARKFLASLKSPTEESPYVEPIDSPKADSEALNPSSSAVTGSKKPKKNKKADTLNPIFYTPKATTSSTPQSAEKTKLQPAKTVTVLTNTKEQVAEPQPNFFGWDAKMLQTVQTSIEWGAVIATVLCFATYLPTIIETISNSTLLAGRVVESNATAISVEKLVSTTVDVISSPIQQANISAAYNETSTLLFNATTAIGEYIFSFQQPFSIENLPLNTTLNNTLSSVGTFVESTNSSPPIMNLVSITSTNTPTLPKTIKPVILSIGNYTDSAASLLKAGISSAQTLTPHSFLNQIFQHPINLESVAKAVENMPLLLPAPANKIWLLSDLENLIPSFGELTNSTQTITTLVRMTSNSSFALLDAAKPSILSIGKYTDSAVSLLKAGISSAQTLTPHSFLSQTAPLPVNLGSVANTPLLPPPLAAKFALLSDLNVDPTQVTTAVSSLWDTISQISPYTAIGVGLGAVIVLGGLAYKATLYSGFFQKNQEQDKNVAPTLPKLSDDIASIDPVISPKEITQPSDIVVPAPETSSGAPGDVTSESTTSVVPVPETSPGAKGDVTSESTTSVVPVPETSPGATGDVTPKSTTSVVPTSTTPTSYENDNIIHHYSIADWNKETTTKTAIYVDRNNDGKKVFTQQIRLEKPEDITFYPFDLTETSSTHHASLDDLCATVLAGRNHPKFPKTAEALKAEVAAERLKINQAILDKFGVVTTETITEINKYRAALESKSPLLVKINQISFSAANRPNMVTDPILEETLKTALLANEKSEEDLKRILKVQHKYLFNSDCNGHSYVNAKGETVFLNTAKAASQDRDSDTIQNLSSVEICGKKMYTGRVETEKKAIEQGTHILSEELGLKVALSKKTATAITIEPDFIKGKRGIKWVKGCIELEYSVQSLMSDSDTFNLKAQLRGQIENQEKTFIQKERAVLKALRESKDGINVEIDGQVYKLKLKPILFSQSFSWFINAKTPAREGNLSPKISLEGWRSLKPLLMTKLDTLEKSSDAHKKLELHINTVDYHFTSWTPMKYHLDPLRLFLEMGHLLQELDIPTVLHCKSSTDRTGMGLAMMTAMKQYKELGFVIPDDMNDLKDEEVFKQLCALNLAASHQNTRGSRNEPLGLAIENFPAQNPMLIECLPEAYLKDNSTEADKYNRYLKNSYYPGLLLDGFLGIFSFSFALVQSPFATIYQVCGFCFGLSTDWTPLYDWSIAFKHTINELRYPSQIPSKSVRSDDFLKNRDLISKKNKTTFNSPLAAEQRALKTVEQRAIEADKALGWQVFGS